MAARFGSDPRRSLLWLGFAASYLMLFNPMNEANSYAILAPALGLWAWWHARQGHLQTTGWLLLVMILTMTFLPYLLRPWSGNAFANSWHPAMALIFLCLLVRQLWISPAPAPDPGTPATPP